MKRNILLLNMAAAFLWMGMYAYTPILSAYAASLGASVVMIGIIGGSYGVMQILLRIPLGILTDKLNKDKLLLVIGFVVLTASALLFVFAQSPAALVVARGSAGAAAAWWVVICAVYANYQDDDKQVKAQGTIAAAGSIGKVAASLLCAFVAQAISYHATFILALLVSAVGLALMFFLKKPPERHTQPATLNAQLALIKNKDLIAVSVLALLSQVQCFGVVTTFAPVAAEALGADGLQLGVLSTIFFAVSCLFSFFVGSRAYQKIGGINAVALSFVVGAVACIPVFYTVNLPLIYLMQSLSGASYGLAQGALAGFSIRSVQPQLRGAATGIFQSIFGIGILLGPVIMGFLIDYISFDAAYWAMFATMAAAAVLSYVLIPKRYGQMT